MAKTKKKKTKKAAAKKKAPAKKRPASHKTSTRKPAGKPTARGGLNIVVAPSLEARLRMLATNMSKSMDEILVQALHEFAETWEDHLQTVAALRESEDRVQLSVPKE